jgi:hypothetical protein
MVTALTVEERLAVLEKDVAALKQGPPASQVKPNWIEKITGSFKDDPDFAEILRLGHEFRKAERLEDVNGDA